MGFWRWFINAADIIVRGHIPPLMQEFERDLEATRTRRRMLELDNALAAASVEPVYHEVSDYLTLTGGKRLGIRVAASPSPTLVCVFAGNDEYLLNPDTAINLGLDLVSTGTKALSVTSSLAVATAPVRAAE